METKIEVHGFLCELSAFEINGILANKNDFGDNYDVGPESAEPYGCGNMRFLPKLPTNNILEKYKISADEYDTIALILKDKLSFGYCGLCVQRRIK